MKRYIKECRYCAITRLNFRQCGVSAKQNFKISFKNENISRLIYENLLGSEQLQTIGKRAAN